MSSSSKPSSKRPRTDLDTSGETVDPPHSPKGKEREDLAQVEAISSPIRARSVPSPEETHALSTQLRSRQDAWDAQDDQDDFAELQKIMDEINRNQRIAQASGPILEAMRAKRNPSLANASEEELVDRFVAVIEGVETSDWPTLQREARRFGELDLDSSFVTEGYAILAFEKEEEARACRHEIHLELPKATILPIHKLLDTDCVADAIHTVYVEIPNELTTAIQPRLAFPTKSIIHKGKGAVISCFKESHKFRLLKEGKIIINKREYPVTPGITNSVFKLFIGGFPSKAKRRQIASALSKAGVKTETLDMLRDEKEGNRPKSCAFATFSDVNMYLKCLRCPPTFEGKTLTVQPPKKKKKTSTD